MQNKKVKQIAIQGFPGAFHEIAARYYHGAQIEIIPEATFEGVVRSSSRYDGGMMAIENSIAGSLMYNYTLLHNSTLNIIGEIFLRIKHNLMTLPGQKLQELKEVHSHPMAIAQCREFFKKLPHIRLIETEDTAGSARNIRENNMTGVGAIASSAAAKLYQLDIMAASIETNKQNYTRFLALDDLSPTPEIDTFNKVSLCFSLEHRVGSLHEVLSTLAMEGANLTKIQSMPIVGNRWNYQFFIDFILENPKDYTKIMSTLQTRTTNLSIMGHYKSGKHYEN